ncbi:MAG: YihY/virulence factor BrkB family protein, partial [Leptospiraceae bacterium]|nr:YihY/virulence factor BrkB family protein [Leptospiraceae bacterium]
RRSLPLWFTIIGKTLVNLFIFIICFLMFFSAYKFIPNTRVDWRAAAGGSLFTAVTILGFFIAFRLWITGFTTTGYIYGVWAAIPLGMLVILSSTQIILFGLELSYIIQHPILYTRDRRKNKQRDSLLWSCLNLLAMIYHRLYGENSALTEEQAIIHFDSNGNGNLAYIRETLVDAKLISFNEVSGEFYPTKPASQIRICDLQSFLIQHALQMPTRFVQLDPKWQSQMDATFQARLSRLQKNMPSRAHELNLADILPLLAEPAKRK